MGGLGSLGQEGGAGNCSGEGVQPAGNLHKESVMVCARKQ